VSLRAPLARYLAGEGSGEITLMHFALQFGDAALLGSLLVSLAEAAPERRELAELMRLAETNMDHLGQLNALAKDGLVSIPSDEGDAVAAIREQFDRAVAVAPEASVALYSLGSADILDRATTEIATCLAQWGLLRPDATVLDIGCGIGRIERVLAPLVGTITAIDVSTGMIEEARRRCRDLANVAFEQCGGRDLAAFRERSFDLVLAVDSFPYLFAADPEIAAQHLRDAARVLRPGGAVVILNFSYRGDEEADRRDIERLAGINGFTIIRAGTRDFTLWDGLSFRLTLPARHE
jgi:SAM-dependent methyltransferase